MKTPKIPGSPKRRGSVKTLALKLWRRAAGEIFFFPTAATMVPNTGAWPSTFPQPGRAGRPYPRPTGWRPALLPPGCGIPGPISPSSPDGGPRTPTASAKHLGQPLPAQTRRLTAPVCLPLDGDSSTPCSSPGDPPGGRLRPGSESGPGARRRCVLPSACRSGTILAPYPTAASRS